MSIIMGQTQFKISNFFAGALHKVNIPSEESIPKSKCPSPSPHVGAYFFWNALLFVHYPTTLRDDVFIAF